VSSSSSGDRGSRAKGPANWLSFTTKSYASFWKFLQAGRARRLERDSAVTLGSERACGVTFGLGPRLRPRLRHAGIRGLLRGGLHVVDPVLLGGRDRHRRVDLAIAANASSTATTVDSASVLK